jgi:hypothetical protein
MKNQRSADFMNRRGFSWRVLSRPFIDLLISHVFEIVDSATRIVPPSTIGDILPLDVAMRLDDIDDKPEPTSQNYLTLHSRILETVVIGLLIKLFYRGSIETQGHAPRHFEKTTNLIITGSFFSAWPTGNRNLFKGLKIY